VTVQAVRLAPYKYSYLLTYLYSSTKTKYCRTVLTQQNSAIYLLCACATDTL